ncbi:katanin p60 ATPase-containing subunit A1-like [Solanum dulcamara]|uniref:katanin p60 ATPase-containing subunit A1-like n=1 Tax=Solanum dulcamara TaxID=45834 RepID=UPI002486AEE8|nr:katanin p60 ATPase-containing subunit A1-like [Solanum dulcamara]
MDQLYCAGEYWCTDSSQKLLYSICTKLRLYIIYNIVIVLLNTYLNTEEGVESKAKYDVPHPELASRLEKEILDTNPGFKRDDVAGLSKEKRILQEAMIFPLLMPEYFQGNRRPWRRFLMFGPPRTGKTLLAKVVATECGTTFLNISCSSLCGKWYGKSEQLTWCLFEIVHTHAPTTIFIDEIDSLCSARGRRLEKRIYIPLPDFKSHKELIKINLKSIKLASGLDIDQVARRPEGYSGDNLTNICRDASLNGMRQKIAGKTTKEIKNISKFEILNILVTMDDFIEALDKIQPTVSVRDIQRHEKWLSEFGSS